MNDLMLHFWIVRWCTLLWWRICLFLLTPMPSHIYYLKLPWQPFLRVHTCLQRGGLLSIYINISMHQRGKAGTCGCIRKVADSNPQQKRQHPHVRLHLQYAFMLNSWWGSGHWSVHADMMYLHSLCVAVEFTRMWQWFNRRAHLKSTRPGNPKTVLR